MHDQVCKAHSTHQVPTTPQALWTCRPPPQHPSPSRTHIAHTCARGSCSRLQQMPYHKALPVTHTGGGMGEPTTHTYTHIWLRLL